jgi:hypothetical protein
MMKFRRFLKLSRRHLLLTALAVLLLSALAAAGFWLASWGLERSLRVPINAYLRSRTLALLREQNLEGLTITFPALELSLVRHRLLIPDLKIRYDHRDSIGYTRFTATAPLISLEGLALSDLLWRQRLRVRSIRISNPRLARYQESTDAGRITAPPPSAPESGSDAAAEARALAGQVPSLDSVIYGLVDNWLPDDFRETRIDQIAVDGAILGATTRRGRHSTRDSTAGLAFTIRGLGLDTASQKVFESAELKAVSFIHVGSGGTDSLSIQRIAFRLDRTDTVLTVREFRSVPAPGRLAVYLAGFRRSERERTFTLDTLALEPAESDSAFLRHPSLRRTRIRLNLAGVLGTHVDLRALLDRRVKGGDIHIARLGLDVLADRRSPQARIGASRPKPLWPQRLADLDWKLQLDTLRIDTGALRYAELRAEWPVPAVIWFSGITATLSGLSNDPADSTRPARAVLQASGGFMDQARVALRMEVPVANRFKLTAEGRVDHLPAPALNSFLLVSDGIRIKSGRVDKAMFQFTVADQRAQGTLTTIYDSLAIDLVDRTTRTQSLGQKFKSFVAATFLVRSSNLPDKKGAVHSARIDYLYARSESFWGGFWRALRSGIVSQIRK